MLGRARAAPAGARSRRARPVAAPPYARTVAVRTPTGPRPVTAPRAAAGAPSPSPPQLAALAGVALLSAFAHLHRLGATTALLDELTYQRSGLDAVRGTATAPAQPYLARLLFGAAQVVLGEGLPAARGVSAVASILTGLALVAVGRRMAGWWAGVGAFALWSVLPQSTRAPDGSLTMVKLGRSALLEPVMVLFVVLAVLAGLRWAASGAWRDATWTGLALGAAVASKPTAALVAPVVAGAAAFALGASRRTAGQLVAAAGAAAAVFLASYLPLGGEAPGALHHLVRYQVQEHAATGHPVIVAGEVHPAAPWWAFAWWQWRSTGTAALAALLTAAVAAVALLPRAPVRTVAAAAVVPFLALSAFAAFGLPHYVHLWQPLVVVLAASGTTALLRRAPLARLGGMALVAVLAVVGARTLATVATTAPRGYGAVPVLLAGHDLPAAAVVVWGQTLVAGAYLPGAQIVLNPGEATRPVVAVIVDPGTVARDPRPAVAAFLEEAGPSFTTTRVDHLVVHVRR